MTKKLKIIAYTFRTFPKIDGLKNIFSEVFVFGKLKDDLPKFIALIQDEKPDLIVGVAKSAGKSKIEPVAVNKFNTGKILEGGPAQYNLYIPSKLKMDINLSPTTSFCNWTAYQVTNAVTIPTSFVHISLNDLNKLKLLLQK